MLTYDVFKLQAIIRKAQFYKICKKFDNKDDNPEAHDILKKIIGLALLPPHLIPEGINYVGLRAREEARDTEKMAKFFCLFRQRVDESCNSFQI